MKNPRLKGVVNKFGEKYNLEDKISIRYQQFINYLFLKQIYFKSNGVYPYESTFTTDMLSAIDLDTDNERAMAIDGCFAIHKKELFHLNMDTDEINEKFNDIDDGDLNVILLQTKSGKFETEALSTLSDCLSSKFQAQQKWKQFVEFRNLCECLIQKKPNVHIIFSVFYIYGEETNENTFNSEPFKVREQSLRKQMMDFFWIQNKKDCNIEYFNEREVYAEYERQVESSREIDHILIFEQITNEIICSDFGKVRVGIVSLKELLKILVDETTQKPNELYGYNVRDYIDQSGVNGKIEDTLKNNAELFLLLNNGITMVVDKQERKGENGIYLKNIRIVNGCQTCHSIMKIMMDNPNLGAKVSVKIIEAITSSILGKITYSSNNQNQVKKENLFAIEPKIFELEKAYENFFLENSHTKFLYVKLERRQGQFNYQSENYIDILAQAKAYASLWYIKPNEALMYADKPLDEYKKIIEDPFFIEKSLYAGIMWYSIEKIIPKDYYSGRFHIYTCIARALLEDNFECEIKDIDCSQLQNVLAKWNGNIRQQVTLVCNVIDSLPDTFPKTKSTGRIHYRKFYVTDAFQIIYKEYKKIRFNVNTTTKK